jgi:hypothetical protein
MKIDEIDYSLPYGCRYKSGMIIPGGVNICNSTTPAEYYKVTGLITIFGEEPIETAWIARELHDGGGFAIRWAVEPITYKNAYSIGDRVVDDITKKTFEVIAYRRATFGEKYISALNKTTIITGSTITERWIVSEVCNYTIQTCNRIWDESICGYAIVPEFEIRVYDRAVKNGDYGFCFTDSGSFVCDVDENYFSFPLWKYCEFVSGVNPLEEQKKQKAWSYETAFKLNDIVQDTSNHKAYAGKFWIASYRIPQANEYYISRLFTNETSTYINHTGPRGFYEDSPSYWILEKIYDYETEFKIGDVVTDRLTKKQYRVVSWAVPSGSSRIISRFSTQANVAIVASGTTDKRWIVEPVETNPYLECSPAELWSYIRILDLGKQDDYRKLYEAFMKRCK